MPVIPSTTDRRIVLKAGYSDGGAEHEEGTASGAISPGMNVNMTTAASNAGRDTYIAGATPVGGTAATGATAYVKIAKESFLEGKTIDDAYASGDAIFWHMCKPGDVILVLVLSGQTIVKGNKGEANAAGKWIVATISGVVEFLDASGGALGADTHMRARVM